MTVHKIA